MLLASWDSYLPTHPASLIPGLPQLAPLLAALTLLAVVWSLGRLILQIIFTRFLHAHISIGRVGWTSLNDIEWSLLRNAKGTRTAKVQRVRIQRIALTLRGRGAKDNDIRLAWLGLAIRGVSVQVKLVPSADSHGSDPATLESSDGASSDGHASYPASPTRTQAFSPTPNFASLTFSSRTNASPPPSQPSLMRQIAQILLNSFKTIHNIRRRARRILVKCIPEPKRRTLFRGLRQATRFLRHRIAAPVLTQINSFGRSCNIITMFLALEITDITVDIPQLESQVNIGLIRLGGELVRRSKNYVGLWTRLEQFYVVRQAKSESKAYGVNSAKVQSSASKAVEVAGPLLMEAQAHFDPSIGMAALYHRTETGGLEPRKSILSLSFSFLRASSSFSKDEKVTTTSTGGAAGGMVPSSIKIRLNTLLWVIDKMKKTIDPDPQLHFGPHLGVHLHARELNGDHARSDTPHSRTESDAPTFEQEGPSRIFDDYPQRPVIPTSRNPAAMLKSIAFSIPLVKVEARLPKLSEKPRTPIAAHQHMQIEMRLRGLAAEAVVSKMLNSDDRHLHWFGRTTPLKLAAKLGFEKFDIDAAAIMPESCERKPVAVIPDPLLTSVYPASLGKPVRLVEVSPSGLHISSSWLPPRADALFREPHRQPDISEESGANAWETSVEPTSPVQKDNRQDSERDMDERSSGLAVIEADVGGVNGEAGLEMVQGLLLVLAAHRAKIEALKQTQNEETDRFSESEATSKSWQACSPPTVAVVVELGRCGYRIMGPKVSHRASFGPGEDDAETSPGFSTPSLVAVHILSLVITMQTRYADVPVHRTEAQRRELKQEIKRGSIFVPNILFRGSQSQRASEMRAREIRKRMFDSPRMDEDQEEWSQSMSPVSPDDTADTGHDMQRPDGNKAKSPIPLTASFYRDNGFLCFVTRDDGQMPEYARRIAANHAATHREVQEHPFVYFIDATVTCQKVDIYLLASQDQQPASVRSNPTSASSDGSRRGPGSSNARSHTTNPHTHGHTRRQSRPPPTKRFDILSLDSVELALKLEVLGHELSTGEHGLDQAAFVSLVDLQDTHGSVGLACDGLRTEASRVEVHHCLSALLHLSNKMPAAESGNDSETLASFTSQSTATRSDQTLVPQRRAPRVQPLAQALPANISFSVGLANIECFVAGPDPKYMPDVCRGLALKISQFTLQRYRQNRYVAPQSHAHIRAPLGLPPDLRAHAQSVFNETGDKEQAFVTVRLQALRVNPLRDTGKDNKILRAKVPVNASGRNTTGDVDTEYIKNSTWCSLPRNQFFPNLDSCTDKSEASADRDSNYQKQDKAPFEVSAAKVRDFFLIPEIDARITMWTRPVETTVDSETSPTVQRTRQSTGSTDLPTFQDCIGLSVRIPSVILRVEMTQIYCSLLAYSAIRSLMPPKDVTNAKASGTRQRIHWQIKCNVLRTHLYWTLPHNVKLYMHLRRVDVSTHKEGLQVELESATFAGESHICRGLWEDIVKIRKWTLIYRKEAETGNKHDQITLKGEGGRLRIPCKYPFSEIVDNLVTCVKLSKQLAHQFVKGKFSSAIEPRAEAPKHVPEIRITMAVLVLEAADDPFEAKLNLIWSAGKEQQTHRLRREAIFHERLASLREQEQEAPREAPANARLSEDGGQAIHLSFPAAHVDDEKQGPGHPTQQRQPNIIHLRQRFLREQSRQWIKSVKESQAHRLREEERHLKQLYGKTRSNDDELPIQLLNHHGNTPLMRVVLGDLDVKLSRPTFDVDNGGLADFLYDVGKGMPRDTQYSLIIPFHLDWRMNEAKVHIRDYPIPLLDIPKFVDDSKSAPDGTQSWHLATDFVIAEELAGADSIRHVSATVVPAEHGNPHNSSSGYFYRIPRTAMPVKFYALPIVTVTSDSATRLCWGNSIQPAIQDVMRVMDSLTKPPPDPSERLGFWDKIRLILHWQIQINFEGAGPLHLILKGSRDPYQVTGIGAGFALSWHDGIKWRIGYDNADREFFQIFSDRFVLGVPGECDHRHSLHKARSLLTVEVFLRSEQLRCEGLERSDERTVKGRRVFHSGGLTTKLFYHSR